MYGQIPYMYPNAFMQSMPALNSVGAAGNLGASAAKTGTGITGLLSKINFSSILSNAQKTLNVVNQAVPLYYQVKPVFKNIKTLGRIGKEFRNIGSTTNNVNTKENINSTNETLNNDSNTQDNNISNNIPEPTFFL